MLRRVQAAVVKQCSSRAVRRLADYTAVVSLRPNLRERLPRDAVRKVRGHPVQYQLLEQIVLLERRVPLDYAESTSRRIGPGVYSYFMRGLKFVCHQSAFASDADFSNFSLLRTSRHSRRPAWN